LSRRLTILIMLLTMLSAGAVSASIDDQFERANKFYEEQQYDSAIVGYEQIVSEGAESAPLFFNLGNAYFRQGDLGHAVLYYLRAKRLDPGDADIAANLDFARRFISIQMEGVQLNPVSSLMDSIVAPYRLNTWAWLASVCFILFFAVLIIRYGFGWRNGLTKAGAIVMLVLVVSAALLTTIKYDVEYLTTRAVVVSEECVVHTGPSDRSPKELDAAPGLVVEVLDQSGDFYNVLFENKRRGWVKKDLVAVV
jgi:tetratricopeptide (TPR) repeat protein